MNHSAPQRFLMSPDAQPWFKPRSFLRELGVGMMGAAGFIAAGILAWAVVS